MSVLRHDFRGAKRAISNFQAHVFPKNLEVENLFYASIIWVILITKLFSSVLTPFWIRRYGLLKTLYPATPDLSDIDQYHTTILQISTNNFNRNIHWILSHLVANHPKKINFVPKKSLFQFPDLFGRLQRATKII